MNKAFKILMYKCQLSKSKSLDNLQLGLLYLYVFSIPFYQKGSSILIGLCFIGSIGLIMRNRRIYFNKSYLVPILLYLVYAFSLLLSENKDFSFLENRASLLVFPIIFLTINPRSLKGEKAFTYFVYGNLIALILCYINAFYISFSINNGHIIFQPIVNAEFSFLYSVVRDGNYFFEDLFSIFHQSTYFAYYLNFAIACVISFSMWRKSKLFLIILIIFAVAIFQLSSKIGIVILLVQSLFFVYVKIKKPTIKVIFGILVLVSGFLAFSLNPRGETMVNNFRSNQFEYKQNQRFGYSLRLMSWQSSYELVKAKPLFGFGLGDTQIALDNQYMKNGFTTPLDRHYNAHNQFMQIILECGIVGLVLILIFFIILGRKSSLLSEVGILTAVFFIISIISFLFESTLNRYSGISFFTFFFCYLIVHDSYYKINRSNEN